MIFLVERLHNFFWRGCAILFDERLREFFFERLHDVFVWRGCVMFLCEEVV